MSEELKPCPFCQSAAVDVEDYWTGAFAVGCVNIACVAFVGGQVAKWSNAAACVDVWNRRTPIQFTSDNLRPVTKGEGQ